MAYLEELLSEFRKGAKIKLIGSREDEYYYIKHNVIYNQNETPIKDFSISVILSDFWEFYQEPIDWNYIIENRCLCWFWDDNLNWAICGILGKIEKGAEYEFIMFDDAGNRSSYKNCRPVHKDEVTFYEDVEK